MKTLSLCAFATLREVNSYCGISRLWLCWYDAQGNWILTDAEQQRTRSELALQQLELEQRRASLATEQVLQTARNLLDSGMSIAQVSQLTGLPEIQGTVRKPSPIGRKS